MYIIAVLYGLKACMLLKLDLISLNFVIIQFLIKLFNTTGTSLTIIIVNSILLLKCHEFYGLKALADARSLLSVAIVFVKFQPCVR